MNDKTPITVLTYRMQQIEKAFYEYKDNTDKTINNLLAEIALLKRSKSDNPYFKVDVSKNEKTALKNGKRDMLTCAKRWGKFKEQLNSGMTIPQVAKEWGCSRKSVYYAISKNFIAGKVNNVQNKVD